MNYVLLLSLSLSTLLWEACSPKEAISETDSPLDLTDAPVECFVTSETQSPLFLPVRLEYDKQPSANSHPIYVDAAESFQVMDGFGAAITGSTCYNLLKMTPENRKAILTEAFDPRKGMGYSFIRIAIGCSDFSLDEYTWCDRVGMDHFAVHPEDRDYLFPILREIRSINPDLKIMGSPWTPPRWMKVNNLTELQPFDSWTGGQLNPKYYDDYADYFVRWIQTMEQEGFPIYAVTLQNEPLNKGNSASLFMTWQEQRDFIKQSVGPKFHQARLTTRLLCYDHNYDYDGHKPECADQNGYPIHILDDPEAAQYVYGSAWHAYGGDKSELIRVHRAHPDKSIYFTEMSIGNWGSGYSFKNDFMWNMREVCIGTLNLFGRGVIMWNFMLDADHGPYRPGGCDMCVGCIDISNKDYSTLTRNSHYYTMAHLSKVIRPGAKRIASKGAPKEGIYYVAVENTDGSLALILQNDSDREEQITLVSTPGSITYSLGAKSVASFRWNKSK